MSPSQNRQRSSLASSDLAVPPETQAAARAEFDQFAENYRAGFDDPLKRILGDSPKAFLRPKIRLLARAMRTMRPAFCSQSIRVLDFGCGAGDFLTGLGDTWPTWILEGSDVSERMLVEAKKRLGTKHANITLWNSSLTMAPPGTYDLITIICVLHHVEPTQVRSTLREVVNMLKPGGLLGVIEHNPLNPITRWMVSRTEVDRNATLVSPELLQTSLSLAEFNATCVRYFLFLPPRLDVFSALESLIDWVPLGGQYAFFGLKK
jgi:2-polyprenyl-3-methyl-5-hydroxy-6-metoxy-1,4-benzoquinol methylase